MNPVRKPLLTTLFLILAVVPASLLFCQPKKIKAQEDWFRKDYDIPLNIPHGTWDFDEWPGVDHPVLYKENYMYNSATNDKIKIDYFSSVFDTDDHEGYLKTPEQLKEKFADFTEVLTAKKAAGTPFLLGIFAHPDDEIFLAGGALAMAREMGWNVKVYIVSNGADEGKGESDEPSEELKAYNSLGVMKDGTMKVATNRVGESKLTDIKNYSAELKVDIEVLPVDFEVNGKRIRQIGEAPGLDFEKTFGPGTTTRSVIRETIAKMIDSLKPSIVMTHGLDGDYNNYVHKMLNQILLGLYKEGGKGRYELYTCFPEYNYQDKITHFVDLDQNNKSAREMKYEAFKEVSFLYKSGRDYDKPWDPNDKLMDGEFVKDYGYTPAEAYPPRYEFFKKYD